MTQRLFSPTQLQWFLSFVHPLLSLSMIREASGLSDTHPALCIEENSLSLGLVHLSNEKQQEWRWEQLWLCTTKWVALGLAVIFQENANVDYNYFDFLPRFHSIE